LNCLCGVPRLPSRPGHGRVPVQVRLRVCRRRPVGAAFCDEVLCARACFDAVLPSAVVCP
jgi:hypothetical protein